MIFDAASEGTHVILGMLIVGLDLPRRDRASASCRTGPATAGRSAARAPPDVLAD